MINEIGYEYKFRVYDNTIQQIAELARYGNPDTYKEIDYLIRDLEGSDKYSEPFAYFETEVDHDGLVAMERGIISVRRYEHLNEADRLGKETREKQKVSIKSFEDITLEQFCFKSWELNRIRLLFNEGRARDAETRFYDFVNSFSRIEISLRLQVGNEKLRIIDSRTIGIKRG